MDINEVSPDSATPDKAAEGSAMLAVDGLPASVRRYIDAVCRIYHCPREFVVAAVMATAATAVGKKIKVDRRSGYTMLIRDPFCNIIGDLQTGMLRPTFGSELFMTNGLNQRFLFTIAEDIDYPERSHATLPADTAREWEQTVRMLYEGIYHDSCGNHCTLFRSSDGDDGAPTTKTATLRSLLRFYPETNRSRLAEALGVSGALISKVGKEARLRG